METNSGIHDERKERHRFKRENFIFQILAVKEWPKVDRGQSSVPLFPDVKWEPELFPVAGEWSFETRFDIIIRDACFEFSA